MSLKDIQMRCWLLGTNLCHTEGEMACDAFSRSNQHVVAACTRISVGNSTVQALQTANICTWCLVPTLALAVPLHHPKPIPWPIEELAHILPISLISSLPFQRTEPSSATSATAGSPRRPLSRDTLCKSTVTSPTSVTAARPPSATRGTSPATKLSTQVQCWPQTQLTGDAVSCWACGCLTGLVPGAVSRALCHKLSPVR